MKYRDTLIYPASELVQMLSFSPQMRSICICWATLTKNLAVLEVYF